jgi:hypothetical protein
MQHCIRQDADALLRSIEGTLNYNLGKVLPWAKGEPQILRVDRVDPNVAYGIRVNVAQSLLVDGINLSTDARCDDATVTLESEGAESITGTVVPVNGRQALIRLAPIANTGVYTMTLTMQRKRKFWFGCYSQSARAMIPVLPEPLFRVRYTVETQAPVTERKEFDVGRLDLTNDKCDGDRIASATFVFPPGGWTYAGHRWVEESASGSEKRAERYTGANAVYVEYLVPERGEFLCTGPRKWVHGHMILIGEREVPGPIRTLEGAFPRLTYGETYTLAPAETPQIRALDTLAAQGLPGDSSSARTVLQEMKRMRGTFADSLLAAWKREAAKTRWSISLSIVFPDGSRHDLPPRSGSGALSAAADGAAYEWDPATTLLTVKTPVASCSVP